MRAAPGLSRPGRRGQTGEAKPGEASLRAKRTRSGPRAPRTGKNPAGADLAAAQAALESRDRQDLPACRSRHARPRVDVQGTPEGLLFKLTDDLNFSMFAVGSAEPRPEMVRAMERLAQGARRAARADRRPRPYRQPPVPLRGLRQLAALDRARPLWRLHAHPGRDRSGADLARRGKQPTGRRATPRIRRRPRTGGSRFFLQGSPGWRVTRIERTLPAVLGLLATAIAKPVAAEPASASVAVARPGQPAPSRPRAGCSPCFRSRRRGRARLWSGCARCNCCRIAWQPDRWALTRASPC